MLGISSVSDGTLSASERTGANNKKPKTLPKSKPKKKPMPLPKPKPKQYNLKAGGKGTAAQRLKEIERNKVLAKVKKAAQKKGK
jgi:hypothetical protein